MFQTTSYNNLLACVIAASFSSQGLCFLHWADTWASTLHPSLLCTLDSCLLAPSPSHYMTQWNNKQLSRREDRIVGGNVLNVLSPQFLPDMGLKFLALFYGITFRFLLRITSLFLDFCLELQKHFFWIWNMLHPNMTTCYIKYFFSKCVCTCMHTQVCACSVWESCWVQKGCQIPWIQNSRHLWTIRNGCWLRMEPGFSRRAIISSFLALNILRESSLGNVIT